MSFSQVGLVGTGTSGVTIVIRLTNSGDLVIEGSGPEQILATHPLSPLNAESEPAIFNPNLLSITYSLCPGHLAK